MREIDVLVVGAGPGGMSAAQYAARAGYSTLVLDPMGPGGQLLYIDEIENTIYYSVEEYDEEKHGWLLEEQKTAYEI